MKRDFDLFVYGAAGYTGRPIAELTSYGGDDGGPDVAFRGGTVVA